MADYRCYCLDRHGCVRAVTALAAENDESARACGALLLATCTHESAEIWDGRRRVGMVDRPAGPANLEAAPHPTLATARPRSSPHTQIAPGAPTVPPPWNWTDRPLG